MSRSILVVMFIVAAGLSGCATGPSTVEVAPSAGPAIAPPAPGIAPEDLVGRWGFASYHKDEDRDRTVVQARGQCRHPYIIGRGQRGGVMMHLADQAQPTELRTKAGPDGRRYLGPEGPARDAADREIVSFDGRVLILRWIDTEIAGRYGVAAYVRCSPRA